MPTLTLEDASKIVSAARKIYGFRALLGNSVNCGYDEFVKRHNLFVEAVCEEHHISRFDADKLPLETELGKKSSAALEKLRELFE